MQKTLAIQQEKRREIGKKIKLEDKKERRKRREHNEGTNMWEQTNKEDN